MKDFVRRFGMRHHDTGVEYFSNVRSGLIVALLSIGTLFGALVAAPIADWIGRKRSIVVWCLIFCVGIIVQITATDKWYQIMLGRLVAGFGVGALSLLVPMYQVSLELEAFIEYWTNMTRPKLLPVTSEVPSSPPTNS
jgi:SP family sugar:H+ symporter-like MFS transporter